MLAQVIKSLSSTRSTSKQRSLSLWNIRAILFVTLFIAIELSSTVEARPARKTNAFRIVTVMSKEGRYLTIGKQGITGVYVYSPYAKLKIQSAGFNGQITIKAVMMRKYLAMDNRGNVSLVSSKTRETIFIDQRKIRSPFASIRSKSFPSRYLAISGKGVVSGSTRKTSANTKFVFFPAK